MKKLLPISADDVTFIFGNNNLEANLNIDQCYCGQCQDGYCSSIINYSISLNNLLDIQLKGVCAKCNHPVGKYIETGEDPITAMNAEAIWETHIALQELKIKKGN